MPASLVLRGGRVFTADPGLFFTSAVAIDGERITAVGDDDAIASHIGPGTNVVDLEGRMVTPGFIDAHVHPATSGLDLLRVSFEECRSAEDALRVVARYAAANPDLPWIVGAGWYQIWFDRACPPKEALDAVVADRPVLLWNTDGHGAWANSLALRIAGIDANTPDPTDGRIERRADGSPQGTLHEGAVELVEPFAPRDGADEFEAGLLRGQEVLLSHGITGWQDANVDPEVHEAYLRLARDGRLKARVVGAMWWDRHRGMDQVAELIERKRESGPRFSPTSVKLMLDGVVENFTAAMLEAYLDGSGAATANSGKDFIEPDDLEHIVPALDRHGFQCHFHVIGDRAARHALNAIEAAVEANGRGDNRHHLAHLQVVHPDDIPRFGSLGAIANAQPLWACGEQTQTELTMPFLGPDRSAWQYPFGSLLRSGARLGMGSDWGVSTANVMEEIDVAVTRQCDDAPVFFQQNLVSPVEALSAFTSGSAYINHREGDCGRLAPGMLADVAILDGDPIEVGSFRDVGVEATLIGGEVVFADGWGEGLPRA